MFKIFEKSVSGNIPESHDLPGKKTLRRRCLVLLASVISLLSAEAAVLTKAVPAALPGDESVLLAQQLNGRVAHLVCGPYDIIIRFVGYAGSSEFSYQSHGIYLENGVQEGETYRFFNNDFEYRVVTRSANAGENFGRGSLSVLHYGETLVTKSCTWD
ncbi:MAG: hypothetical protein WBG38_17980 [Nodosilinea sp.]